MACDAAILIEQGKCLSQGLSTHQLYAAWATLLCGAPPPPGGTGITTDPDGLVITDEDGNIITID